MVFQKYEHSCTERTTSVHFLKMVKILAVFTKQKALTKCKCFFFGIRRLHTLPGRVQPSTICVERLNFCVRYENRWTPFAIATEMVECF